MSVQNKKIKIATIIGARPQFIKAAFVSRVIAAGERGHFCFECCIMSLPQVVHIALPPQCFCRLSCTLLLCPVFGDSYNHASIRQLGLDLTLSWALGAMGRRYRLVIFIQ